MKIRFVPALLFALAVAGCATDREKIVFLSDDNQPKHIRNDLPPVAPPKKTLEQQDRIKVDLEIFGWLLQRHFGDDGGYSGIFLQADEAETAALMKLYPAHVPPIKPLQHVELRPEKSPLDRDTGRPAMVLSVDALDSEDETVEAIGKWFAGDAVTGFYTFTLRKSGEEWHIESVK
jgi:hypothetical protein